MEPDCDHYEYCPCDFPDSPRNERCDACGFYRFIDSGYGYCIALPTPVVVPWCRVVCSLYKEVTP